MTGLNRLRRKFYCISVYAGLGLELGDGAVLDLFRILLRVDSDSTVKLKATSCRQDKMKRRR